MPVGNHPAGPVVADGPRIAPPGAPLGASAWGPTTTAGGALTAGVELRHVTTETTSVPLVAYAANAWWAVSPDIVPAGELWHLDHLAMSYAVSQWSKTFTSRGIDALAMSADAAGAATTSPGTVLSSHPNLMYALGGSSYSAAPTAATDWGLLIPPDGAHLTAGWTWGVHWIGTGTTLPPAAHIYATIARYQVVAG